MAQVRNEILTEEELLEYFNQEIKNSVFNWINASEEDIKQWGYPEEFHKSILSLRKIGCVEYASRASESILQSLSRLNRIPRFDLFWTGTNKRPTIFKLTDFCRNILKDDPNDLLALWTLAALRVFGGANDFAQEIWARLHRIGHFKVCWPICAAIITELNASHSGPDLVLFLREEGIVEDALAALEEMKSGAEGLVSKWITDATNALKNV